MIEASLRLDRPGFAFQVDLALPSEGVSAIFGHSGSGKTTLLRCLAGLEPAAEGRIVFNGEVWQDGKHRLPPHRRPIGYVFQEASLFPHLSVMGNLRFGQRRIPRSQQGSLDEVIELLGIAPLLDRKPDGLSGGERQRVSMARALAVKPRLLLMDEPLVGLDVKRKQEVFPYLDRLREELKIPVLYVSHAPDEVARLADHLVVMEAGRVLASAPLQEALARLDLPIKLGEEAGVVLDATVGALEKDWHLARVDFAGGSLWTPDQGIAIGRKVRVRVLARDVSLAQQHQHSSIQNVLSGVVDAIGEDGHPGLLLARVRIGESLFLCRLTKRAAASLQIEVGREVWLQVKSVALVG